MPHRTPTTHTPEPVIRLLRTVLEEARDVLHGAGGEQSLLLLEERIQRVQEEAALLAPDFPSVNVQNGASGG